MRRSRYFYEHNKGEALTRQLKCMVEFPFDPATIGLQTNILVLHGEKDTVVPVAMAHELVAALDKLRGESAPGSTRLIIYPRANHVPMDVDPAKFAVDVRAFLDGDRRG